MSTGGSSAAPDASSPGNAITGGYDGNSFTVRSCIVLFSSLSMYNALELIVLIFFTFTKFSGLYFWSILISSICVIPYALGFLFKFMEITTGNGRWLAVTLITIGWYGMVTGQAVVLWSRLHLLVEGEKGIRTLRWTKWMICINAVILHIPTTVLTYGSNGNIETHTFVTGYNVMEKIQMCGFFLQEVILSALYIQAALRLLRNSMREDAKKFLWQLLGINIIIIILDLGLLSVEAASLYLYETIFKGVIYSIKLKLEFAILGKLIHFVGGPSGTSVDYANEERWRKASLAYAETHEDDRSSGMKPETNENATNTGLDRVGTADLADFVDMSKVRSHVSHAASNHSQLSDNAKSGGARQRSSTIPHRRGVSVADVDLARFEHGDDSVLPEDDGEIFESESHHSNEDGIV